MLENKVLSLQEIASQNIRKLTVSQNVVGFPYFWQVPAATEKTAYESMIRLDADNDFVYIGVPWATIIDGVRGRSKKAWEILHFLSKINTLLSDDKRKRVTVCQHIHGYQFINLFTAVGITDLLWTHATIDSPMLEGVKIHPFPLFPAQAPSRPQKYVGAEKTYFCNFIGAFNPNVYLTNVRELIFEDMGAREDEIIIKRDGWHFNRAVYDEQIGNQKADISTISREDHDKKEYLDAIRNSWFTLCPSGSGPNSIRIYECLNLESIPLILTKDLRLPGSQSLWEKSAIIESDSEEGYRNAMKRARATSEEERKNMLMKGRLLAQKVGPKSYAKIISSAVK